MPDAPKRSLTPKQRLFIDAYLGDCRFNASAAALAAGYSVRQSASDVLSNPAVRARIDERLAASAASADEVLALLAEDAHLKPADILAQALEAESPAVGAALVSSLVSARSSARQSLAKAHGLFTDRLHLTGSVATYVYQGVDPDGFDEPAEPDGEGG